METQSNIELENPLSLDKIEIQASLDKLSELQEVLRGYAGKTCETSENLRSEYYSELKNFHTLRLKLYCCIS